MKITKSQLRKIIKEEMEKTLAESREQHIAGLSKKIERLRQAQDDVDRSIANDEEGAQGDDMILMDIRSTNSYFSKQQEQANLADKVLLLLKQLRQLQNAPEGKGNVGQLERD